MASARWLAIPVALLIASAFPLAASSDGREATAGTFVGGSEFDEVTTVEVGPDGSIYVAGSSGSFEMGATAGSRDTFVARYSADLKTRYWVVAVGGSEFDEARDIAVASDGSVVVAGETYSKDFPTSSGFFDTTPGSLDASDGFVYRVSRDGALSYAGYLGGSDYDDIKDVDFDAAGRPTLVGWTHSCDFPTTSGAWRRTLPSCPTEYPDSDAFVTKISPDGSRIEASTLLGGSSYDFAHSAATSRSSGTVTVGGITGSADFPTHAGAYDRTLDGTNDFDGFVAKLDNALTTVQYGTFLGGSGHDVIFGLSRDGSSNVYLTGYTMSLDFPTTTGAAQRSHQSPDDCYGGPGAEIDTCSDGFVTKLSADFSRLVYSTYLGTIREDEGNAIAVDSAGRAHVAGSVDSFRTLESYDDIGNGTLWVLSADGTRIEHTQTLGGSRWDDGQDLALAASSSYVVGYTASSDFRPLNGHDLTLGGYDDGYIARVAPGATQGFTFDHKAGNEWWVEVAVSPRAVAVQAMDTGGSWKTLTLRSWGNWAGSFQIEPGHDVRFRAQDASGAWHESCWFSHPDGVPECDVTPPDVTFDHKGGNEWWVEVVVAGGTPSQVQAMDENSAWKTLTLRSWGNWAGSFHIEPGNHVRFRAMVDGVWHESCWFTHPGGTASSGGQTC